MNPKSTVLNILLLFISIGATAKNTPIDTLQSIQTIQYTAVENTASTLPDISSMGGYAATGIGELEKANPYDEIRLMTIPEANSMGTATTSFPPKLPNGRRGLAPSLSIDYNSEGENGWLGLGWDLSIPAISIDPRWGVPLFDANKETETYLFAGSQLYPVAHRSTPVARKADFQFHPRVEGAFAKIIRHGNSPKNYWWEVRNTDGSKSYYGGLPEQGVLDNAVLKDTKGNIAYWVLTKVEEIHGNFIRYYCTVQADKGNPKSNINGFQIYPQRIAYTGFNDAEGAYEVKFIRDRELGEKKRKDVTIHYKMGFKEVNADLLRKIEVLMQGELIRTYELTYQEGAFYKTLLKSVAEYDKNGELFYQHDLDYFDEVRNNGDYQPFTNVQKWETPLDNITANFVNPIPLFEDKTTVLGGSTSSSFVGGSAATVGPLGPLASKEFTAGGNFAIGKSNAEGLVALVDINGDGLPDKVFKQNGNLFFRPNLKVSNGQNAFGGKRPIKGIKIFSSMKTNIKSFGFEANVTPVFVGYDDTTEKTTTETYFSDFNGDQLIDIAHKGKVYFNHIDEEGNPNFTLNSGDTPSPINADGTVDGDLMEVDPAAQAALLEENPLHDVVRVWEAPYDGTISITGSARLVDSPEGVNYPQKDGVKVTIQASAFPLWSSEISGDDFSAKTHNLTDIQIAKGTRIYFRVQSVVDGAFDLVEWNPIIGYES
ncbi:MAG: SpvB/TcaC N-terminal domain-containing protein, partial [Bacteroidota bacterium]